MAPLLYISGCELLKERSPTFYFELFQKLSATLVLLCFINFVEQWMTMWWTISQLCSFSRPVWRYWERSVLTMMIPAVQELIGVKRSGLRSCFCKRQSRSRSRSRKRSRKNAYDLVKIKNRSRKRSHKRDGIRVRRIRTFPFLPTPLTNPSLTPRYNLVKTRLSESEAEAEG